MNDDIIAGRWKQLIGQATTRFGQLTSADWTALGGRVESFVGRLQERFGLACEAVCTVALMPRTMIGAAAVPWA